MSTSGYCGRDEAGGGGWGWGGGGLLVSSVAMRGKVQSFRVRKCKREIQREKQNTVGLVGREDARRVGKGVGFKMGGVSWGSDREKREERLHLGA